MDANFIDLRTPMIAAVTLLQQDTQPLDARVQAAQALLLAALADSPPDPDVSRLNTALDPSTGHLRDQLAVSSA